VAGGWPFIGAVGVGLLLARFIRRSWLHEDDARNALQRIGVEGFGRVLAPLLIAGLVWGAKVCPATAPDVHLLQVALPLFTSMALIRIVFYLLRRVFARHGQLGAALRHLRENPGAARLGRGGAVLTGMWPDIIHFLEHKLNCRSARSACLAARHPARPGLGRCPDDAGAVGRRRARRPPDGLRACTPRCAWCWRG
jgi:hypothetical protein